MVDETYTFTAKGNEYTVTRTDTECIVRVPENFFITQKLRNEHHGRWKRRAAGEFFDELNNIPQVENADFMLATKVGIILLQADTWPDIVDKVKTAFVAHLIRQERGHYED